MKVVFTSVSCLTIVTCFIVPTTCQRFQVNYFPFTAKESLRTRREAQSHNHLSSSSPIQEKIHFKIVPTYNYSSSHNELKGPSSIPFYNASSTPRVNLSSINVRAEINVRNNKPSDITSDTPLNTAETITKSVKKIFQLNSNHKTTNGQTPDRHNLNIFPFYIKDKKINKRYPYFSENSTSLPTIAAPNSSILTMTTFLTLINLNSTPSVANEDNILLESLPSPAKLFHVEPPADSSPKLTSSFHSRVGIHSHHSNYEALRLARAKRLPYPSYGLSSSFFEPTSTPATVFDPESPTNISAQLGSSVYIPCKIKNLGNKTVSWIRTRDSHILTVGRFIFIADARFDSWHQEDTSTWILLIKYVQDRDEGRYECQVSTEPKMSHFVYFKVVSPLVTIPGGSDIHVKVGSPVSIKCFINDALEQPQYIFWYKGHERIVNGIFWEKISNDSSVGTLVIGHASQSDAGSYQCAPEKLTPAKVTLHVINGEHPEAMHGRSSMIGRGSPGMLLLSLALLETMKKIAHFSFFCT